MAAPEPVAITTARDPALPVQSGLTADERHPAVREPRHLGGVVEIVDDLVAALEHGLDVKPAGDGLPHAGHPRVLPQQLIGAQQRLGGHAGPVGAFAADELALDQADIKSLLGEPAGAHLAGRSGTDDDHLVRWHPPHRRGPDPAGQDTSRSLPVSTS
jgi:hypothetical protein